MTQSIVRQQLRGSSGSDALPSGTIDILFCGDIDTCELSIPAGDPPSISDLLNELVRALDDAKDVFGDQVIPEVEDLLANVIGVLIIDDPAASVVPFSVGGAITNIPGVAGNQVTFCELGGKMHVISTHLCEAANAAHRLTVQHGLPLSGLAQLLRVTSDVADGLGVALPCLYSVLLTAEMYLCGAVQGFETGFIVGCAACGLSEPGASPDAGNGSPAAPGFDFLIDLIVDPDEIESELVAALLEIQVMALQFTGEAGDPPVLPARMAAWQYSCHDAGGVPEFSAHAYFDAAFKPDGTTQFFGLNDVDPSSFRINGEPAEAFIQHDVWKVSKTGPNEDDGVSKATKHVSQILGDLARRRSEFDAVRRNVVDTVGRPDEAMDLHSGILLGAAVLTPSGGLLPGSVGRPLDNHFGSSRGRASTPVVCSNRSRAEVLVEQPGQ